MLTMLVKAASYIIDLRKRVRYSHCKFHVKRNIILKEKIMSTTPYLFNFTELCYYTYYFDISIGKYVNHIFLGLNFHRNMPHT